MWPKPSFLRSLHSWQSKLSQARVVAAVHSQLQWHQMTHLGSIFLPAHIKYWSVPTSSWSQLWLPLWLYLSCLLVPWCKESKTLCSMYLNRILLLPLTKVHSLRRLNPITLQNLKVGKLEAQNHLLTPPWVFGNHDVLVRALREAEPYRERLILRNWLMQL